MSNKKCFVVCPIGPENSDIRNQSDELLKYVIEPVCESCGFTAIRVDNIHASDSITETILEHLKTADLVIADLTGHNPNAFFELGYRSALQKPFIQIKNKNDAIPFDVANTRTFDYDLSSLSATDKFKQKLIQTIETFDFDNLSSEDETNSKDLHSQNNFQFQILQILYGLQESIDKLDKKLQPSSPDANVVSILVDKLKDTQKPSKEELALKFLQNPNAIMQLKELNDLFDNNLFKNKN